MRSPARNPLAFRAPAARDCACSLVAAVRTSITRHLPHRETSVTASSGDVGIRCEPMHKVCFTRTLSQTFVYALGGPSVADSRHRHARKAPRRVNLSRAVLPTAGLLTLTAAGALVVAHDPQSPVEAAAQPKQDLFAVSAEKTNDISRSAERAPLTSEAVADDKVKHT